MQSTVSTSGSDKDLGRRVEELERELAEAHRREAATAEVLKVISRSPTDVQPVFDTIVANAAHLCDAAFSAVAMFEGGLLQLVAVNKMSPEETKAYHTVFPRPPGRHFIMGRAFVDRQPVHVADIEADPDYDPHTLATLKAAAPYRTFLGMPILRGGVPIGAIGCGRREVKPFTEAQIALVKTFADQAVIAIENTRLFEEVQARTREVTESLEYQTATSDVLGLINRSKFDLQPVLDTLVESATRLCQADCGFIWKLEDNVFYLAAFSKVAPELAKFARENPTALDRSTAAGRSVLEKRTIHVPDVSTDADYGWHGGQGQAVGKYRTSLGVPLLRDDKAYGAFTLLRTAAKPFSEKEIELVTTFADQALIAIENTRLFEAEQASNRELQESLEYQTATSDVLNVISRSPTDVQPVFDMIAESAARLCEAQYCFVYRFDGQLLHFVAHHGLTAEVLEINRRAYPAPPGRTSVAARAVLERSVVQIPDVNADPDYALGVMAAAGGYSSAAAVPILRHGLPIGSIAVTRAQAGLLPDRQIELLQTFADQAVIAFENTRLFEAEQARTRELTEALEQQTATSEVLSAISRSPGELEPVFQAMLQSAVRICAAKFGNLWLREGDRFRLVAAHDAPPAWAERWQREPVIHPGPGTGLGRVARTKQVVHIADLTKEQAYIEGDPLFVAQVELAGGRTLLVVPMLKDTELIGSIGIFRQDVRPFTDKQIALVTSFATQAVIAIENTRLLNELRESLQQQTATADVLKVISRSTFDLPTVLNTLVQSAAELCEAEIANIWRPKGATYHLAASYGVESQHKDWLAYKEYLAGVAYRPERGSVVGRTLLGGNTIQIDDVRTDPEYDQRGALAGVRTMLGVPLLRDGSPIGVMVLVRATVRPFTDKQVELIEAFAGQAVIAIENTRLFEEVQARTRELTESLEYQTATSDVLSVISRSPSQVQPVFDTIARTARRLCQAERASIFRLEDGTYRLVAVDGVRHVELEQQLAQARLAPGRGSITGRVAIERRPVHVHDVQADREITMLPAGSHADYLRTTLGVPLLRQNAVVGVIILARGEVKPFAERQIELVETFADQAVIAIENTRLFEEVQARTGELSEALEQQTATSEVLGVISSSPGELEPVFRAMLEKAVNICEAGFGVLFRSEGDAVRAIALHGAPPLYAEERKRNPLIRPVPETPLARALATKKAVQIADIQEERAHSEGSPLVKLAGARSVLAVPMVKENEVGGAILIYRQEVRPFSEKQIELVTNFAKQAVIAIENTRLLNELRESLQQQTATANVLKAISRSPTDIHPVFDTIVENVVQLGDGVSGFVYQFDGALIHLVAHGGIVSAEALRVFNSVYPLKPSRTSVVAQAILDRSIIHVRDFESDSGIAQSKASQDMARAVGHRSLLAAPMLRDGRPIGAIVVGRRELGGAPRPFSDRDIELVTTFADQAVIAVENARLFEEVQARNRDLTQALEQQTATSELLKVIGRSTFNLQPVFDTLAENAVRLCEAQRAMIFRFDGEVLQVVAAYNISPELRAFHELNPIAPGRGSCVGRMALERRTIHIHDVRADPEYNFGGQQLSPYRTLIAVPMLKGGELLGAINIVRHEVLPFTDSQIALIETFADQAVIAIENTRLFEEVQARNRDLTALGEVGRAVSSTLDLKVVLKTIVDRAVELSGTDAGSIFYYREDVGAFELGETVGLDEETVARFRKLDISARQTGLGEAIAKRQPLQAPDVTKRASNPLRDAALEAGLRAALIVPLLGAEGPLGALVLQRRRPGEFSATVVSLMQTFADQSAIALENAHLFEEIARKGRELEIASQHKSQFVANMSHELRTPLAAILGYAELIQEGFYGPLPEKSTAALTRIRSNGKHLLGLINSVLDIAKIEAGQFSLSLAEYSLDSVVETVRVATESLAETKKLALKTDVAKKLPVGLGDEQRLTQVLLNLVGNAIKFTDTGEVRISAGTKNGHFVVAVTDTGPGIPDQELKRVFEQFHQVDSSNTKAKGGTGLGLAIAKQIVEMHGGRIWVESTLGQGATFQMQLPIRAEFRKGTA